MPSTQVVVSTFWAVWSQLTLGMTKPSSSLMFSANSLNRRRFQPQVQLQPGRTVERFNHLGRLQPPRRAHQPFGQARAGIIALDIGHEALGDAGPQDLDRNRAARAIGRHQLGLMHLGDGGGGNRRGEFGQLGRLGAERLAQNGGHQGRIERLHLVLQAREIGRDLGARRCRAASPGSGRI